MLSLNTNLKRMKFVKNNINPMAHLEGLQHVTAKLIRMKDSVNTNYVEL